MSGGLGRAIWLAGWPVRQAILLPIRAYRLTVGKLVGGNCRFYPSCSAYAEAAIERCGAVRGSALALWRIVRCSPLSAGGIDHPPAGGTWRALHADAVGGRGHADLHGATGAAA